MLESKDALIQHYNAMRDGLLAAISGLSDDLLSEPSLDGWSVKDHLAHLALWDSIRAGEIVRISAGYSTAWRTHGEMDETINQMTQSLRKGLSVAQVKWELATSRQRVIDAITSATPRGLDPSLYGEASLRTTHEAQHTGWILRWRREKGV